MSAPELPPLIPNPVTVNFTISRFDLIKCRWWRLLHQMNFLCMNIGFSLLFALVDWNSLASLTIALKIPILITVAAIFFTFITTLNMLLQIVLALSSKNRGLVGNMTIEIRADGVLEKTEVGESLHRWAGFQKLRSSTNCYYLYVTDSNALYVPKRSFPSPIEAARFEAEILQRTRKA